MGYTHYFSRSRNVSKSRWAKFAGELRQVLEHPAVAGLVCEDYDKPNTPPLITEACVAFNGKGDAGHETFFLERAAHRGFCKTGGISQMDYADSWGKHYDIAVCCALILANRHLGEVVASDGSWTDDGWMRARALCAHVTSSISPCPWPERACVQCSRKFRVDGHSWGGSDACSKCGSGSCKVERGVTTCYKCGAVGPFRRAKPTTWCWYCANGYKNKKDAAAGLMKQWTSLLKSLKRLKVVPS